MFSTLPNNVLTQDLNDISALIPCIPVVSNPRGSLPVGATLCPRFLFVQKPAMSYTKTGRDLLVAGQIFPITSDGPCCIYLTEILLVPMTDFDFLVETPRKLRCV